MPPAPKKELLTVAKKYAEYCTLAYQMFASELQYPEDPFFPEYGNREQLQKMLRKQAKLLNQPLEPMLDWTSFDYSKIDPKKSVFQGTGGGNSGGIYFDPPAFTTKIGTVWHQDKIIKEYPKINNQENSIDLYVFEGVTGATTDHPGTKSPMGYVAYNQETGEISMVFRGSRSGSAEEGALNGLFDGSGNPDWVTDMDLANELISKPDLVSQGRVAAGFSSTYLSCRPEIIQILAQIRKNHPDPKLPQQLTVTGHSLGGALASIAYADLTSGTFAAELKKELGNHEKDKNYVNLLVNSTRCWAFSAPPVLDQIAAQKVATTSAKLESKFHRVYFKNDPIVWGGNPLRIIRGKRLFADKELLTNIPGLEINLGDFADHRPFDLGSPHELYLLHEQLQKELGTPEDKIKRYWYTINQNLEITHASKERSPISITPQQAAVIFSQFNSEYFLALSLTMAEIESHHSQDTELMKYIKEIGDFFKKSDPFAGEKEFQEYQKNLLEIIGKLSTNIANDEKSWLRYPRKVAHLLLSILKVVLATISIVLELCQGIYEWLKYKPSQTQNPLLMLSAKLQQEADQLTTNLALFITQTANNQPQINNILKYNQALLKALTSINQKTNQLQTLATKDNNIENLDLLEGLNQLISSLEKCTLASKEAINFSSDSLQTKTKEQFASEYQNLSTATYELAEQLANLEEKLLLQKERWQTPWGGFEVNHKKKALNILMVGTGLLFRLQIALAKTAKSLLALKKSIISLFTPETTVRTYMHRTLNELATALTKTDYQTLVKFKPKQEESLNLDPATIKP